MNSERITEILREPLNEVNDTAALLKLERRIGEQEKTWRERVARAMQRHLWPEGMPYPAHMAERDASIELQAILESEEVNDVPSEAPAPQN